MRTTSGMVTRRAMLVAALVAVACIAAAQFASTTEVRATCIVSPYCDHSHQVHCPNGATYPSECAAQLACHYDCGAGGGPGNCGGRPCVDL
jgi:hypothetical protein